MKIKNIKKTMNNSYMSLIYDNILIIFSYNMLIYDLYVL